MKQEVLLHKSVQTQKSYLEMQFNISRDLIRLHQGLQQIIGKPGNGVYFKTCKQLSEHQLRLQQIEERFLSLQQGFISYISVRYHGSPKTSKSISFLRSEAEKKSFLDKKLSVPPISSSEKTTSVETDKTFLPSSRPLPLPLRKAQEIIEPVSQQDLESKSKKEFLVESSSGIEIPEPLKKHKRPIRLRYQFESFFFKLLQHWSEKASEESIGRFRSLLAFSLFRIFRVRRKVVEANLEWAYPELTPGRRSRIARGCYKWGARFALDVLRMRSWQGILEEKVCFHNLELLEEALNEGRGVLMIGAHFGNWEPLCPALTEKGFATTMYVGAQANPLTDLLQNETRRRWKIDTIEKGKEATLRIWDALKQNRVVGMLIDQDERKKGVFVDFFGRTASSNTGAASFHLMQQSPILLFTCPYIRNRVEIRFQKLDFQKTGTQEEDLKRLTQQMLAGLESTIRRYPEQYFWMHKRWRTRPPQDSTSLY